jgi:hypothetical protein
VRCWGGGTYFALARPFLNTRRPQVSRSFVDVPETPAGSTDEWRDVVTDCIPLTDITQMNYEMALEHHLKHLEVADSVGQFVAHTNLGLMSASLGQKKAASYSYEQAIKCTVQV